MVRLKDGRYIIGFDNGYQFGKTAGRLFENGVYAMGKVEPSINEHTLKYKRKYYEIRKGRAAITEDRVSDENAGLLTIAAAAGSSDGNGVIQHYAERMHPVSCPGYLGLCFSTVKMKGSDHQVDSFLNQLPFFC